MFFRYGMTGYQPISISLEHNVKLYAEKGELLEDMTVYICIVSSPINMTSTRPDLSYVVRLVNQFMQVLRKTHLDVAKCILEICEFHFVVWTFLLGWVPDTGTWIHIAYLASSISNKRSTCGCMFFLESVAVDWSSKK